MIFKGPSVANNCLRPESARSKCFQIKKHESKPKRDPVCDPKQEHKTYAA